MKCLVPDTFYMSSHKYCFSQLIKYKLQILLVNELLVY